MCIRVKRSGNKADKQGGITRVSISREDTRINHLQMIAFSFVNQMRKNGAI